VAGQIEIAAARVSVMSFAIIMPIIRIAQFPGQGDAA
jgi:hypothetical protein